MAYYGKRRSLRFVARFLSRGLLAAALVTVSSCSKEDSAETTAKSGPDVEHLTSFTFAADTLLPDAIETYDLGRPAAPLVVRPDSLAGYDGIDAALYIDCNVIGLAAADYVLKGVPLKAEIVECAEPQDAYGLYSQFRPNGTTTENIGDESFRLDQTRFTVRGTYFIRIRTLAAPDSANDAGAFLAQEIVSRIGSQPRMPAFHILFPSSDKIASSNRYYSYHFLGIPGFDQVYTTDFVVSGDTVTLFLTVDESGIKFLNLQKYGKEHGKAIAVPPIFLFDSGFSTYFDDPARGKIIAGLARQKLVGAVPYNSQTQERKMSSWISGLQK